MVVIAFIKALVSNRFFPLWCTCTEKHSVQISSVIWRWWEGNCLLCLVRICLQAGQSMHCSSVVQERPQAAVSLARLMLCSALINFFLFHFFQSCLTNNLWENRSGIDGKSEACGRTTWNGVWNEIKRIYTTCFRDTYTVFLSLWRTERRLIHI